MRFKTCKCDVCNTKFYIEDDLKTKGVLCPQCMKPLIVYSVDNKHYNTRLAEPADTKYFEYNYV